MRKNLYFYGRKQDKQRILSKERRKRVKTDEAMYVMNEEKLN